MLASANTAAAGLIATESSARVAASLAETNIRVAAEAQVLAQALADAHADMISFVNEEQEERTAADNDIRSYVSGAISTIISGGTATLQALDTINNIYAAITGDSSGVVSGLLLLKPILLRLIPLQRLTRLRRVLLLADPRNTFTLALTGELAAMALT